MPKNLCPVNPLFLVRVTCVENPEFLNHFMLVIKLIFRMPKLIGNWQKSHSVLAEQGADLVLHTGIQAFKFPDNSQVHITCDVQVHIYG